MLTTNFRHLKIPSPTYPGGSNSSMANNIETDERWGEKRPSYRELHSKFGCETFRDFHPAAFVVGSRMLESS